MGCRKQHHSPLTLVSLVIRWEFRSLAATVSIKSSMRNASFDAASLTSSKCGKVNVHFLFFFRFFLLFNCSCCSRPSCFYENGPGVDVLTTSITTTIPEKKKMKKLKDKEERKMKEKK